jgi:hypothetical protein
VLRLINHDMSMPRAPWTGRAPRVYKQGPGASRTTPPPSSSMGFFKSSRSHLEVIEQDCIGVTDLANSSRAKSEESLRGKFQNMMPEDRAGLLKEAGVMARKARTSFVAAQERQALMEKDQCSSEDLLAAETKALAAKLDLERMDKAIAEATSSLMSGMAEIEQFYGPRSKEARHIRRILEDLG